MSNKNCSKLDVKRKYYELPDPFKEKAAEIFEGYHYLDSKIRFTAHCLGVPETENDDFYKTVEEDLKKNGGINVVSIINDYYLQNKENSNE